MSRECGHRPTEIGQVAALHFSAALPTMVSNRPCIKYAASIPAQVDGTNVRQAPEEEQLYRGVHAPMRKAVADEPEALTEMPKVRPKLSASCPADLRIFQTL